MGGVLHDEEAAVFQAHAGGGVGEVFVFESEFTFRAEAEGGDGAVGDDGFFVVAVPTHAFAAVMIEIEQAGVETGGGMSFYHVFQLYQFVAPWKRLAGGARVGVGETGIPIPSDFAGRDIAFPEEGDFVIYPRHLLKQSVEKTPRFAGVEHRAVVVYRAVAGEQIHGGVVAEQFHLSPCHRDGMEQNGFLPAVRSVLINRRSCPPIQP